MVGPRRLGKGGKCVGQLYLKLHKSVENLFVVVVKKDAEDAASAARLPCNALLFVYVMDFAMSDQFYFFSSSIFYFCVFKLCYTIPMVSKN